MGNIPAGGVFENIQAVRFRIVVPYVMHDVIYYNTRGEKN